MDTAGPTLPSLPLTQRQRLFAQEYVVSGKARDSAVKAGYKPSNAGSAASRNLANPGVRALISELGRRVEDEKIASAGEVMQVLTRIIRGEATEDVAFLNPQTGEVVKDSKHADTGSVTRAAAELLKRYPLPVRVQVSAPVSLSLGFQPGSLRSVPEPDDEPGQ